jgi:hypothetical protein
MMEEFGGPMIDRTEISVAADRMGELSNFEQLSAKKFIVAER